MKNLILIISLILGFTTKAQQTELIENTWYLEKLVIDDEEVFPPKVIIASFSPFVMITHVCNELFGDVMYNDDNNTFVTTSGWGTTFIECELYEHEIFENIYFYEFWNDGYTEVAQPYHYEIVSGDNAMQLIITNSLGSKAYYNNAPLSISEVNLVANHFQIAFHHEDLVVKSSQSVAESVLIFDLNGRLVQESKVENEKIRTANLPKGIYVVKIIDKNGKTYTQKIRK